MSDAFADAKFQDKEISGDPAKGLAVFCGGLRFFGVPYGRRSVPEGLRMGGFDGQIIYWPWHERWEGPTPTLPALWDVDLQKKHANRIADYLATYRQANPELPVILLGCSAGGGLAVRVLEAFAQRHPGLQIDQAALMSTAVWPGRDLRPLAEKTLRGRLVNFCSLGDVFILGLGTLLFGTADRHHSLSAGMVGLKHTQPGKVENCPYRLSMLRAGRLGGHNSAIRRRFIAQYVAPELAIRPRQS